MCVCVCVWVGVCGDDQVSAAWLELILVLDLLPSQPQPPLDNLPCGRETYIQENVMMVYRYYQLPWST